MKPTRFQTAMDAAFSTDAEKTMSVLIKHGASVNGFYLHEAIYSFTAGRYVTIPNLDRYLFAAIRENSLSKVKFLVSAGADFSIKDIAGKDPLAFSEAVLEIVRKLPQGVQAISFSNRMPRELLIS